MGPLEGFRVVEIAGLGPAPFCGMVLADLGAEVVRIDRAGAAGRHDPSEILARGRRSLAVDLKQPAGTALVLRLVERADALIEGFRPGVMERLGLGPEECFARNRRLVYGRMTGWGQQGPRAAAAGHDIDYIALSGALHCIGTQQTGPVPPLNLVGDFGGGGMLLAVGVLAALLEAGRSGRGQVVDAAMVDGSALLMAMIYGFKAAGGWTGTRGDNVLDGGAHFYGSYRCRDGRYMAVGAYEAEFYAMLLDELGLEGPIRDGQWDRAQWPEYRRQIAAAFATRTQAEWEEVFAASDACVAPILDMDQAPRHPHNAARGTFVDVDGVVQPAPAPRFERTPPRAVAAPRPVGADSVALLQELGLDATEIRSLLDGKVVGAGIESAIRGDRRLP